METLGLSNDNPIIPQYHGITITYKDNIQARTRQYKFHHLTYLREARFARQIFITQVRMKFQEECQYFHEPKASGNTDYE